MGCSCTRKNSIITYLQDKLLIELTWPTTLLLPLFQRLMLEFLLHNLFSNSYTAFPQNTQSPVIFLIHQKAAWCMEFKISKCANHYQRPKLVMYLEFLSNISILLYYTNIRTFISCSDQTSIIRIQTYVSACTTNIILHYMLHLFDNSNVKQQQNYLISFLSL